MENGLGGWEFMGRWDRKRNRWTRAVIPFKRVGKHGTVATPRTCCLRTAGNRRAVMKASPQVPLSVDEIDPERNETPRETQNTPGERKRELTVHPVAPLLMLVRRSVEKNLVFLRDFLGSIAPSIA